MDKKGYNKFFEKEFNDPSKIRLEEKRRKIPYLSSFDMDSYLEEMSSSKLSGGIIRSKDGKLLINLETGDITYNGSSII